MMFQTFLQDNSNGLFGEGRKLFFTHRLSIVVVYPDPWRRLRAAATTRDFFGDVSLAPRVRPTDFRLRK